MITFLGDPIYIFCWIYVAFLYERDLSSIEAKGWKKGNVCVGFGL